jgi:hypothetical protein
LARCKVYEIQGSDPSRTAGAVRCHRDADGTRELDGLQVTICRQHAADGWRLFSEDRWVYAVDLGASGPNR